MVAAGSTQGPPAPYLVICFSSLTLRISKNENVWRKEWWWAKISEATTLLSSTLCFYSASDPGSNGIANRWKRAVPGTRLAGVPCKASQDGGSGHPFLATWPSSEKLLLELSSTAANLAKLPQWWRYTNHEKWKIRHEEAKQYDYDGGEKMCARRKAFLSPLMIVGFVVVQGN